MGIIQRARRLVQSTRGGTAPELQRLQDQIAHLQERSLEQQQEIDELRADSLRIAELRIQVEDSLFTDRV